MFEYRYQFELVVCAEDLMGECKYHRYSNIPFVVDVKGVDFDQVEHSLLKKEAASKYQLTARKITEEEWESYRQEERYDEKLESAPIGRWILIYMS